MARPEKSDESQLRAIFRKVDKDGSGTITALELQQALSNGSWKPFNPQTCHLMIAMFDLNGDGDINFTEFQALWNYVMQWTSCFRGFDKDNSGNVDAEELEAALRRFGYKISRPTVNYMLKRFDRSRSNRLSFDDFIQLCIVLQRLTTVFKERDSARIGQITINYEDFVKMIVDLN